MNRKRVFLVLLLPFLLCKRCVFRSSHAFLGKTHAWQEKCLSGVTIKQGNTWEDSWDSFSAGSLIKNCRKSKEVVLTEKDLQGPKEVGMSILIQESVRLQCIQETFRMKKVVSSFVWTVREDTFLIQQESSSSSSFGIPLFLGEERKSFFHFVDSWGVFIDFPMTWRTVLSHSLFSCAFSLALLFNFFELSLPKFLFLWFCTLDWSCSSEREGRKTNALPNYFGFHRETRVRKIRKESSFALNSSEREGFSFSWQERQVFSFCLVHHLHYCLLSSDWKWERDVHSCHVMSLSSWKTLRCQKPMAEVGWLCDIESLKEIVSRLNDNDFCFELLPLDSTRLRQQCQSLSISSKG